MTVLEVNREAASVQVSPDLDQLIASAVSTWEAFGKAATEEDENPSDEANRVWDEANETHRAAVAALRAYRPSTMAGLIRKAEALADPHLGANLDMEENYEAVRADLKALTASPGAEEGEWRRAFAAFDAARAARQELGERFDAALDAAKAEAPTPDALKRTEGGEYFTADLIERDQRLTFEQKIEKAALLKEWRVHLDAANERHETARLNEEFELADTAEWQAVDRIIDMPAPTVAALRDKVSLVLARGFVDYVGEHPDDETTVSRWLTEGQLDGAWPIARFYQDLCRLTGHDSPALRAQPFDAKAWIDQFERKPGHHVEPGGVMFAEHEGGPPCNADFTPWEALKPWQKTAVRQAAKDRKEDVEDVLASAAPAARVEIGMAGAA